MDSIIKLEQVSKNYRNGSLVQSVLHDISLEVKAGEFLAILGASGNGKSTLLNLLTGIDRPSQGQIYVCGQRIDQMKEEELSLWRGRHLGIVFQFFQLLPSLSLLQNVLLAMDLVGSIAAQERLERAKYLLERVGVYPQAQQLPSQVSGGQQQRAAIARALANDPPLIVADEPTGNLDETNASAILEVFESLLELNKTLVMVTHNQNLANSASRQIEIHSGRIKTARPHTDDRQRV